MANERTESELIEILGTLLTQSHKSMSEQNGACVYNAGGKTYCAEISKSACEQLGGAWVAGGKCP